MSNLLEQAIVDAAALRDAALKNAEAAVIEKYSGQIKEAVEAILLEQPEEEEDPLADPMAMDDPMADPMAAEEEPEPVVDDMPLAALDGENLCPCPEDDEEVEINFDDLAREMEKHAEAPGETHDMAAADVLGAEEEDDLMAPLQEQEVDIDEDLLSSLLEKLTVDVAPSKSGWAGTPKAMVELAEEEILALEKDSITRERNSAIRKAVKELQYEGLKIKLISLPILKPINEKLFFML